MSASPIPHLGLCKLNHPHEPGGGPEQEVDLNKKKKVVNTSIYPDEVIERLAWCFYPAILECFNSEEGQRAFAVWQAEQARPTAKEKQDVPAGERPDIHTQLFSSWVRPSGRTFLYLRIVQTLYKCSTYKRTFIFAEWLKKEDNTSLISFNCISKYGVAKPVSFPWLKYL